MTALVFDTSAYALFKRGHEVAIEFIQSATHILVPAIVLGELLSGFAAGSRAEQNRLELQQFLASPRVVVMPVTEETAYRYATIWLYLRQTGRPIPANDLWIAALTMEHGAVLLSADAHFQHVPQILLHPL